MGATHLSGKLSTHLRAGILGGVLAGALQGLVESFIVSMQYSGYFFGPRNVSGTQIFLVLDNLLGLKPGESSLFVLDRYLGPHLLDKFPFLFNFVTVYILAGAIAGIGVSLLLWGAFRLTKQSLDPRELIVFYGSLFLCFGVFANLMVWLNTRSTFGTFSTAGILINLSCLGNALLLIRPVSNWGRALIIGKFPKTSQVSSSEALWRWSNRTLAFAGLLICTALVLNLSGFSQGEKSGESFANQTNRQVANVMSEFAHEGEDVNIVLISIDSLRADHLSTYGYSRKTSPNIDQLADEGVVFSDAYSVTSWTLPAHLSMLTSLYPLSHGVFTDRARLDENRRILPEVLKEEGYATAAFVSAPYLNSRFGFKQGFDVYDDLLSSEAASRKAAGQVGDALGMVTSPKLTQAIDDWLQGHYQEKFFLFLHYFDVHFDYVPPAPYDTMFDPDYTGTIDGRGFLSNPAIKPDMEPRDLHHILALYDGEIAFTDEYIGKFLSSLKKLGVYDKTLIVLTSDHGDEFFEHGRKGHRATLYDEVLRVPFIIKFPGLWKGGEKSNDVVSIVDIMPTVLGYLGVDSPEEVQGRNLLPLLNGERRGNDAIVYAELMNKQVAARSKSLKLSHRLNFPKAEFYDLLKDPGEQDNLFNGRKTLQLPGGEAHFAALLNWLNGQLRVAQTFQGSAENEKVELNDDLEKQLRALGYIQ